MTTNNIIQIVPVEIEEPVKSFKILSYNTDYYLFNPKSFRISFVKGGKLKGPYYTNDLKKIPLKALQEFKSLITSEIDSSIKQKELMIKEENNQQIKPPSNTLNLSINVIQQQESKKKVFDNNSPIINSLKRSIKSTQFNEPIPKKQKIENKPISRKKKPLKVLHKIEWGDNEPISSLDRSSRTIYIHHVNANINNYHVKDAIRKAINKIDPLCNVHIPVKSTGFIFVMFSNESIARAFRSSSVFEVYLERDRRWMKMCVDKYTPPNRLTYTSDETPHFVYVFGIDRLHSYYMIQFTSQYVAAIARKKEPVSQKYYWKIWFKDEMSKRKFIKDRNGSFVDGNKINILTKMNGE